MSTDHPLTCVPRLQPHPPDSTFTFKFSVDESPPPVSIPWPLGWSSFSSFSSLLRSPSTPFTFLWKWNLYFSSFSTFHFCIYFLPVLSPSVVSFKDCFLSSLFSFRTVSVPPIPGIYIVNLPDDFWSRLHIYIYVYVFYSLVDLIP